MQEHNQFFENVNAQDIAKRINSKRNKPNINILANLNENVQKVTVGENPTEFIIKTSDSQHGLAGIASSKMYNDIGIYTPQIFLLDSKNKLTTKTLQQNISNVNGLDTILASDDIEYIKIERKLFGRYKWQLFYDSDLNHELLKFMTPDCLEQLKNMFLIDEIRTDIDRHTMNYFFYRKSKSDKYEGIIAIDLDQMAIYNYCGEHKDDFQNFLMCPYRSATPQQVTDELSYMQRIRNLRELIQDNVLSPKNLQTLVNALKHDFPADLKKLCRDKKLIGRERSKIVTPIDRLWEYNNKTIGKDLGL